MSDDEQRPIIPPPPERSGCVTALIGIIGVILLLPGLCALIFASGSGSSSELLPFILFGLIVAIFGVLMIVAAIRRASRP